MRTILALTAALLVGGCDPADKARTNRLNDAAIYARQECLRLGGYWSGSGAGTYGTNITGPCFAIDSIIPLGAAPAEDGGTDAED